LQLTKYVAAKNSPARPNPFLTAGKISYQYLYHGQNREPSIGSLSCATVVKAQPLKIGGQSFLATVRSAIDITVPGGQKFRKAAAGLTESRASHWLAKQSSDRGGSQATKELALLFPVSEPQ
jgi:hypothetical protein